MLQISKTVIAHVYISNLVNTYKRTMSLAVIQDPLKGDYEALFRHVLNSQQEKLSSLDVQLNCTIDSANRLNLMLMSVYPQVRQILNELGYSYKFNIDVIFNEIDYEKYEFIYYVASETLNPAIINNSFIPVDIQVPERSLQSKNDDDDYKTNSFNTVAVGGTFDHIHDGHKILLSIALYLTRRTLIVGITDDELLQRKQYKEYLQPFEERLRITNEFIAKMGQPLQEYNFYKINDVYGPTGYLKFIDCLVLSKETAEGGKMVNTKRQEVNLPILKIFTIDLVGGEHKLSSTDLRKIDMEEHERARKRRKVIEK